MGYSNESEWMKWKREMKKRETSEITDNCVVNMWAICVDYLCLNFILDHFLILIFFFLICLLLLKACTSFLLTQQCKSRKQNENNRSKCVEMRATYATIFVRWNCLHAETDYIHQHFWHDIMVQYWYVFELKLLFNAGDENGCHK